MGGELNTKTARVRDTHIPVTFYKTRTVNHHPVNETNNRIITDNMLSGELLKLAGSRDKKRWRSIFGGKYYNIYHQTIADITRYGLAIEGDFD